MAEAEEGDRVYIRYTCKLDDGTIYDALDEDTLEVIIGEGDTLPTIEKALIGMRPGDVRTVRVPLAEVSEFSFTPDPAPMFSRFPAGDAGGPSEGYDINPGEDGESLATDIAPRPADTGEAGGDPLVGSEYLHFDVELVSIGDPGLVLGLES